MADVHASSAVARESGPEYRCPKSRSKDVDWTPFFDAYQLKRGSCSHSQVIETYPERESDADWLAQPGDF